MRQFRPLTKRTIDVTINMSKPRYKWRPMQRATTFKPPAEDLIALVMGEGLSRDEAIAKIEEDRDAIFVNDLYQVSAHFVADVGMVQLNIRRRDGGPILRDWRHFQNIKNDILGPECEAVELYPAESRLVDQANKFHLWGFPDARRFPFGWTEREVNYDDNGTATPGMKQRPL
jgi:hypothetical protein